MSTKHNVDEILRNLATEKACLTQNIEYYQEVCKNAKDLHREVLALQAEDKDLEERYDKRPFEKQVHWELERELLLEENRKQLEEILLGKEDRNLQAEGLENLLKMIDDVRQDVAQELNEAEEIAFAAEALQEAAGGDAEFDSGNDADVEGEGNDENDEEEMNSTHATYGGWSSITGSPERSPLATTLEEAQTFLGQSNIQQVHSSGEPLSPRGSTSEHQALTASQIPPMQETVQRPNITNPAQLSSVFPSPGLVPPWGHHPIQFRTVTPPQVPSGYLPGLRTPSRIPGYQPLLDLSSVLTEEEHAILQSTVQILRAARDSGAYHPSAHAGEATAHAATPTAAQTPGSIPLLESTQGPVQSQVQQAHKRKLSGDDGQEPKRVREE